MLRTFVVCWMCFGQLPSPIEAAEDLLRMRIRSHCMRCHGEDGTKEGEVDLTSLTSPKSVDLAPEILQRVIAVLSDRRMPPEGETPLEELDRGRMADEIRGLLDRILKDYPFPNVPIRRMNRFQYNNAVVDLLELDRDIFQMNERLMRRRDDYFQPVSSQMPESVRVSSRPLSKDIDNQRPEGFRGVAAFPQDKRAEHGFDNQADHLTLSPLLMESFLELGRSVAESPDINPRECRSWNRLFATPGKRPAGVEQGRYEAELGDVFSVVGKPQGSVEPQNLSHYGDDWSRDTHLIWKCTQSATEFTLRFTVDAAGNGLKLGLTRAPDYGRFEVFLDEQKIGDVVDLYAQTVSPGSVEFKGLSIPAGTRTLRFRCVGRNEASTGFYFGLDFADVSGRATKVGKKAPTPMRESLENRLRPLLRKAFRRPVDQQTLEGFVAFAESRLESGMNFQEAMRSVVGAVISMPEFLYLYETFDDAAEKNDAVFHAGRQRVNDFELATRLSQFLWSSIPDDRLLDLAASGQLSEPETLAIEIDRMLNDRRTSRFCDNFPGQWLQLERLITSIPDPQKFGYFYYFGYRSSMHMMSEPLLLFDTVFIENRSIMDLIAPDFTWQSEMLRQNYEGEARSHHEVQVQVFRRVPLDDLRRGGVITNAAVMTMTSTPTRTQPITRGAWLNEVIFNDPPEPPPADVPPLPEVAAEELARLTIRERLAVHRKRSDCASCHDQIDPLGFALENYGPTGVWRDQYENGRDVDSSGRLFKRDDFSTVDEFKKLLIKERHRFIRAFSAHLLTYALGRRPGPADAPSLDRITRGALDGKDQLRTILKQIAMSDSFLHKSNYRQKETSENDQ